ncbi:hypothetical protein [Siminovitchia sp. 179-K 8D1 HS]|uniref:hypothetical protein n=1 Tax=Siminovitchia sp. 179-K 8D1 HS TaxID=3142385 RepID=UPI0039A19448
MEILADAKVKYQYDSLSVEKLVLVVKFKKPNKFFKTKVKRVLCSTWWLGDTYRNRDEFLDDVLAHLSNKNVLEEEVVHMVQKELGLTEKQIVRKSKEDEIRRLLKDSKFTVKVKID